MARTGEGWGVVYGEEKGGAGDAAATEVDWGGGGRWRVGIGEGGFGAKWDRAFASVAPR